jgi:polyhydroxyalkanoate synthesis regulator protein
MQAFVSQSKIHVKQNHYSEATAKKILIAELRVWEERIAQEIGLNPRSVVNFFRMYAEFAKQSRKRESDHAR